VMLNHFGALWRSEYRHMDNITVQQGEKVQRGDRIGSIGSVGNSTSPHLHHRHYRRDTTGQAFRPVKMAFEGVPLRVSVGDSDSKPKTWTPPAPVMVQGPPPRATWQGAYQEAVKLLGQRDRRIAALQTSDGALRDQLGAEKAAHVLTRQAMEAAQSDLHQTRAKLDACELASLRCKSDLDRATGELEVLRPAVTDLRTKLDACEKRPIPDCTAIAAERDGALRRATQEQERANAESDRADTAERRITRAVEALTL